LPINLIFTQSDLPPSKLGGIQWPRRQVRTEPLSSRQRVDGYPAVFFMNVLLIYPEFPDTFWSFKHALKFTGQKALAPPLGLLTIAAMLPPEWPKRLVDMNIRKVSEEDVAWADYAFISAMIVQRESARQAIAQCKKAGVKVVAGGPLFTSEYENFEEVDHFVLNEAEVTLSLFLADLEQGCAKRVYSTTEFADMCKSPIPLWKLADLNQYTMMSIQFSRGCPHDCEFCNVIALFGKRPRHKSVSQIISELDSLYHGQKWRRGIFFVDDNLIGDKRYFKNELLPALIEWQQDKGQIPFNTQVSINLADDEQLMNMMHEAGFDIVFIGIETPDENSLDECGKTQNKNRDLIKDVKRIQQAGLQVQGGFVIGFDSDKPTIFQQQIDFIQESGIVTAMVGLLIALPNTRLYERLRREGRLLDEMSGDNVLASTNVVTVMDSKILVEGYVSLMNYIYAPTNYYQRVRTFLENFKAPEVKVPFKFGHILTVLHSIFLLGFVDEGRLQYWKLLLWTLFHRPKLLSDAILFTIYGYHFRKVCTLQVFQK